MARKLSFGQFIRNTRQQRELSVPEVAERVGVSTAAIYMWETDRGRPRDANLSALCKALRLPVRSTKVLAAA